MGPIHLQTSRAIPDLTQVLGRTPTVPDLAIHLHLSEKDIRDGLRSRFAYQTRSLSLPAGNDEDTELGQLLGGWMGISKAYLTGTLWPSAAGLPARERMILLLRLAEDLTQREIAEQLGISQMHVSRLLGRSLEVLRTMLLGQQ